MVYVQTKGKLGITDRDIIPHIFIRGINSRGTGVLRLYLGLQYLEPLFVIGNGPSECILWGRNSL